MRVNLNELGQILFHLHYFRLLVLADDGPFNAKFVEIDGQSKLDLKNSSFFENVVQNVWDFFPIKNGSSLSRRTTALVSF